MIPSGRIRIEQTPDARKMLLEACAASGMTRQAIAERAGVCTQMLREWFFMRKRPRIDNFVAVANAAGFRVVLEPMDRIT